SPWPWPPASPWWPRTSPSCAPGADLSTGWGRADGVPRRVCWNSRVTSETRAGASHRLMRPALACIAASILLTALIGVLGTSAMVPALPGPGWQPPWSLGADPHPYLVVSLGAAALVLGGLGLLAALAVPPASFPAGLSRSLVLLGCLAAGLLAFLPPSGSGDHLNYAGYGRLAALGIDPYTHGAVDLPGDPVADAVEDPWREEPSVYGPVATAVHFAASWLAGDSVRLTIFLLALVNAAAFIATGLLIDRFVRDDPVARPRAALLWTVNPLLLYQLVAGMHVDTLAIACMVAALAARSRPAAGGALLGLGVAVKLNAGLVALGPAWELRRDPRRLTVMAGVAVAVVAAGYAVAGVEALAPVTRTSKSISNASFWKLVQGWLQSVVGTGSAYRGEIQAGSLLLLALLAWALLRLVARSVIGGEEAVAVAAVMVVAYLFASPYVLPWYVRLGFAVTHLLVLSLAYLPARVVGQPPELEWLRTVVRSQVVPWLLLALTAALLWWAWRAGARVRTRPGSAAPPR